MNLKIPSVDVVLSEARTTINYQIVEAQHLMYRLMFVLLFNSGILAIGILKGLQLDLFTGVGIASFYVVNLVCLKGKLAIQVNLDTLRNDYLVKDEPVTKLHILDSLLTKIDYNKKVIANKALSVNLALSLLVFTFLVLIYSNYV